MTIEETIQLREAAESGDEATRAIATVKLIAAGHYLAYADAKYAAQLALSGAHAGV